MKVIADLHIHSRYAYAVSDKMIFSEINKWAERKGIDLTATGDFTHPLWFREIVSNLEETAKGLFKLKSGKKREGGSGQPLFILQTEISSIYNQKGESRRIHNLIYAPSVAVVEKINKALKKQGVKLMANGRATTGLSSIELCELVFEIDESCLIVPAHIWTPWYSLYGSRSGFDSLEECYGEFAGRIYGIETGLSSDPSMNWKIKELENRAVLSSSDAHSGAKLGREATIFEIPGKKFTYDDIYQAVKTVNYRDRNKARIAGTIEFYPQEGKYHYTGHRKCKVRHSPADTKKKGAVCPVCGKPLTVGVMHRVQQIANSKLPPKASHLPSRKKNILAGMGGQAKLRKDEYGAQWVFHPQNKKPPYTMLVPLQEIISEVVGTGFNTQTVKNEYKKLTNRLGDEFFILLRADLNEITRVSGEKMAQAIKKVRGGEVNIKPGYDGEFGQVHVFGKGEVEDVNKEEQLGIF